jgi:tetratricopeptide (TPR) repeat protein
MYKDKDKVDIYSEVVKMCEKSIEIDPYSFIPEMNKAAAVCLSSKENYKEDAKEYFYLAKNKIDEEIHVYLVLLTLVKELEYSKDYIQSLENKISIYYSIKNIIESNIEEIENSVKSKRGIIPRHIPIEDIYDHSRIQKEIHELKQKGLDKIILFKERAAWWKYTGVIALGVLELVVGLGMVICLPHTGIGALVGMG